MPSSNEASPKMSVVSLASASPAGPPSTTLRAAVPVWYGMFAVTPTGVVTASLDRSTRRTTPDGASAT